MKLDDRRRRRVPRAAGLRRAAGDAASGSGSTRSCCYDIDAATGSTRIGHVLDGLAAEHGVAAAVPRHDRPRGRGPGRRLRVLRDPRRPARGPRRRRGRPARAGRARPGDDRPRRHLLRAAHDPGDDASSPRRCAEHAPDAWLINFTNPAGHGHRGASSRCSATARRHLRLAVGPLPARRRGARARRRRAVVRLLRPQPPRLAAAACATATGATLLDGLLEDDARLDALRGGPAVRRRVAALARDDPERVPLLLLLRGGHGQRDPLEPATRAARSCSSSSARSTPQTGSRRTGAGGLARDAPRPRAHLHGRGAQRRGRRGRARASTSNGGYEGEAMAVLEAIALNTRAVLILNTANRSACRSWTSAPSSRCRASSAAPARCRWPWARCPRTRAR